MTKQPRKPMATENTVEPVVEQHVPIIPGDDKKMPQRLIAIFDKAAEEGKADAGDGCVVRRIDGPAESALINLPSEQWAFFNFGDDPRQKWHPVFALRKESLNGWDFLRASALRIDQASERIYRALEHLHGRGDEPQPVDAYPGGMIDFAGRKYVGVEKLPVACMVEIDPSSPGSASKLQYAKVRGTWLSVRKIDKILRRRLEREQKTYPNISIV
jgi:hypothetical protein